MKASACAMVLVLLSVAKDAVAHSALVRSEPPQDSVVEQVPARVVLHFNADVESRYARLTLVRPGGERTPLVASSRTDGLVSELTAALPELGKGVHEILYSVVAADGHRVAGGVRFTLR